VLVLLVLCWTSELAVVVCAAELMTTGEALAGRETGGSTEGTRSGETCSARRETAGSGEGTRERTCSRETSGTEGPTERACSGETSGAGEGTREGARDSAGVRSGELAAEGTHRPTDREASETGAEG